MESLRIGRLARLANVNVQTLRFYEREGLLANPRRRLSGYREYSVDTVGLVILIKRIQALGFSLKEIKAILALGKASHITVGDAASRLEAKLAEIDAKIGELRQQRNTLAKMVKTHRQGAAVAFAPAFVEHVQQLSRQALAKDKEQARDRKGGQARKKEKAT